MALSTTLRPFSLPTMASREVFRSGQKSASWVVYTRAASWARVPAGLLGSLVVWVPVLLPVLVPLPEVLPGATTLMELEVTRTSLVPRRRPDR